MVEIIFVVIVGPIILVVTSWILTMIGFIVWSIGQIPGRVAARVRYIRDNFGKEHSASRRSPVARPTVPPAPVVARTFLGLKGF